LERTSEHPLARLSFARRETESVVFEKQPLVEPTMFRALTGRGFWDYSGKGFGRVGNRSLPVLGLTIPPQAEVCMKRKSRARLQLVAVNESICAVIELRMSLKADAAESISSPERGHGCGRGW
jgi:cation transport ATPase